MRKYTKTLADEMEAQGVALRESGAYVHRSFDANELEQLKNLAGQKIDFDKSDAVVVANGRGCLVRNARLSKDRKVANFLGRIITLDLLKGKAFSKAEFAARVKDNPITKLIILSTGEKRTGVLYGSLDHPYASLIDVVNNRMRFTDIETKERSNNRDKVVEILPLDKEDYRQGLETQKALAQIAASKT